MTPNEPEPLLTKKQVMKLTTLSAASIYRFIANNRFPKPIHLSANRRAWRAAEVQAWNESPLDWGRDASNDDFFA